MFLEENLNFTIATKKKTTYCIYLSSVPANTRVQEKWKTLIESYEDFTYDHRIEILQYHKLFGMKHH